MSRPEQEINLRDIAEEADAFAADLLRSWTRLNNNESSQLRLMALLLILVSVLLIIQLSWPAEVTTVSILRTVVPAGLAVLSIFLAVAAFREAMFSADKALRARIELHRKVVESEKFVAVAVVMLDKSGSQEGELRSAKQKLSRLASLIRNCTEDLRG